jgi:hypothetical protein
MLKLSSSFLSFNMIKHWLSSGYHYKGHGGKDSKSYGYKVFISRTKLYSVDTIVSFIVVTTRQPVFYHVKT